MPHGGFSVLAEEVWRAPVSGLLHWRRLAQAWMWQGAWAAEGREEGVWKLSAVGSACSPWGGQFFWWQPLKLGYSEGKNRSALLGVATTGANP